MENKLTMKNCDTVPILGKVNFKDLAKNIIGEGDATKLLSTWSKIKAAKTGRL